MNRGRGAMLGTWRSSIYRFNEAPIHESGKGVYVEDKPAADIALQ